MDRVWEQYTPSHLIVDPQSEAGNVTCTISEGLLTYPGDNRGYVRPRTSDLFRCNPGPFATGASDNSVHRVVIPRLCAAFNRGMLLLSGGSTQPLLLPRTYYRGRPNNRYSALVHQVEINGRGYAFPYDDFAPSVRDNTAGVATDEVHMFLHFPKWDGNCWKGSAEASMHVHYCSRSKRAEATALLGSYN